MIKVIASDMDGTLLNEKHKVSKRTEEAIRQATVAMENADPEIKKLAKYITKSNAEDGVACAIETLLKN